MAGRNKWILRLNYEKRLLFYHNSNDVNDDDNDDNNGNNNGNSYSCDFTLMAFLNIKTLNNKNCKSNNNNENHKHQNSNYKNKRKNHSHEARVAMQHMIIKTGDMI